MQSRLTETLFILAAILIAIVVFTSTLKPKIQEFVNGTARSIRVERTINVLG